MPTFRRITNPTQQPTSTANNLASQLAEQERKRALEAAAAARAAAARTPPPPSTATAAASRTPPPATSTNPPPPATSTNPPPPATSTGFSGWASPSNPPPPPPATSTNPPPPATSTGFSGWSNPPPPAQSPPPPPPPAPPATSTGFSGWANPSNPPPPPPAPPAQSPPPPASTTYSSPITVSNSAVTNAVQNENKLTSGGAVQQFGNDRWGGFNNAGGSISDRASGWTNTPTSEQLSSAAAAAAKPTSISDRAGSWTNPPTPEELAGAKGTTLGSRLRDRASGWTNAPTPEQLSGATVYKPPEKPAEQPKSDKELIDAALRKLLEGVPDAGKERQAMLDEMKVQQAQALQTQGARAGLGGMGLTGAAGALETQARRGFARDEAATTAEFDRRQRQEEMARVLAGMEARRSEQVYGAESAMAEKELDYDINGDGMIAGQKVGDGIGDGNPANNPASVAQAATTAKQGLEAVQADLKSAKGFTRVYEEQGKPPINVFDSKANLDQFAADHGLKLQPVEGQTRTYRDQYGVLYGNAW